MGNNGAYTTFQRTVMLLYDRGVLDLDTLDSLAEEYRGTDIDSGGDTGLRAKDGLDLEAVCIKVVDPEWKPVKQEDYPYSDPDDWEWEERYEKWDEIRRGRWGWG